MWSYFWLTEERFGKIKPLLPNKPRGVARVDDRRVLSGIIFCLQRGYRWSEAGVFARVFETLARENAAADDRRRPRQDALHRGQRGQKTPVTAGPSARPEAG